MKLRNLFLVIYDQLPLTRLIRNLWLGRLTGILHKNSHVRSDTGQVKVTYNTKASAVRSAEAMAKKRGVYFSNYKCLWCDGYHIGKNTPINDFENIYESNSKTKSNPSEENRQ